MDIFSQTWSALCAAVAALPDEAFDEPSGCRGWRVRDLVSHLVIDAQDVLITLSTPADTAPTHDALSYWTPSPTPPDGTDPDSDSDPDPDPDDALTMRLASAYEDPALLRAHLESLGAAAGRAALLAHPELPVTTQGKTLTVRDYLGAYVLEAALHHLDLIAHLPSAGLPSAGLPAAESLVSAREMVERRLRVRLPSSWTDTDALRVATGRRPATPDERAELDALGVRGQMLPLSVG